MKIKKQGRFLGVKIVVNSEKEISAFLYIKFREGIYSLLVNSGHDTSSVINDLVERYDLGITNMGTRLAYADYDKMLYFCCNIWDCEQNVFQDMITELDDGVKELISSLLSNVKPDCRIDNIGFSGDMNSLSIVGGLPETAFELKRENDFDEDDWEEQSVQNELRQSLIRLSENVIVSYTNSWVNEWWNGPQSYGGFHRIGKDFTDSGYHDYDYDMSNDKDIGAVCWDENTLVCLTGNASNGIKITCSLKNIRYFQGMLNSASINSDILRDIGMLLKAEFETHEHYEEKAAGSKLRLISIDKMILFFEREIVQKVRENVELYFRKHLPIYTVLEIRRKSYHPDDAYLWMVSAKKEDGTFAVWTSWNESNQSLNYGHYDLKSIEDCEKIFEEFYYRKE